jgi:hypothetical protein
MDSMEERYYLDLDEKRLAQDSRSSSEYESSDEFPGLDMIHTENEALAYYKTDSACVDLFSQVVPDIDVSRLHTLLCLAWGEDALLTTQLIFRMGNVREGGAMDRNNYERSLLWLLQYHPKTALANAHVIKENSSLQCLCRFAVNAMYDKTMGVVNYQVQGLDVLNRAYLDSRAAHRQLENRPSLVHSTKPARVLHTQELDTPVNIPTTTTEISAVHPSHQMRKRERYLKRVSQFAESSGYKLDDVFPEAPFNKQGCQTIESYNSMKRMKKWSKGWEPHRRRVWDFNKHPEAKDAWEKTKAFHFLEQQVRKPYTKLAHQLEMSEITSFKSERKDPRVCDLLVVVKDIFVQGMIEELVSLVQNVSVKCTGCFHKWAPSLNGSVDKATGLGRDIATTLLEKVFTTMVLDPIIPAKSAMPIAVGLRNKFDWKGVQDMFVTDPYVTEPLLEKVFPTMVLDPIIPAKSAMSIAVGLRNKFDWKGVQDMYVTDPAMLSTHEMYGSLLSLVRGKTLVPESFVGGGKFDQVSYKNMPSLCRHTHGKSTFKKNDPARYEEFLDISLKERMQPDIVQTHKVHSAAVLAHKITTTALETYRNVIRNECTLEDATQTSKELTLQFIDTMDRVISHKKKGTGAWIPVVDVSGSMGGIPMEVATTLGLITALANDTKSPWFCNMMTFDENPTIFNFMNSPITSMGEEEDASMASTEDDLAMEMNTVQLEDTVQPNEQDIRSWGDVKNMMAKDVFLLGKIMARISGMEWGGSTDLIATFKLQLMPLMKDQGDEEARRRIAGENLIVFTDMEWNQASSGRDSKTIYDKIKDMYAACGIVTPPRIVFWNLRSSNAIPIHNSNDEGVVLLSSFSAGMLDAFLSSEIESFTPAVYMKQSVAKKPYTDLVVVL